MHTCMCIYINLLLTISQLAKVKSIVCKFFYFMLTNYFVRNLLSAFNEQA